MEALTEEVLGVVYKCSEQAIQELDVFEGVAGGHYRRCTLEVELVGSDQRVEAQVYLAEPTFICDEATPSDEYLSQTQLMTNLAVDTGKAVKAWGY